MVPMILHCGKRPPYWRNMVSDCCYNLRLPKREEALLTYYCDRTNGFKPALKEIEKNTGIKSNKISEIRKALSQKHLIAYDNGYIKIDWFRIRNFAMITDLPNCSFDVKTKAPEKKLKFFEMHDEDAVPHFEKTPRKYTPQEEVWIKKIENMSANEYLYYLELMRQFPDSPKNSFPYMCMYPSNSNFSTNKKKSSYDLNFKLRKLKRTPNHEMPTCHCPNGCEQQSCFWVDDEYHECKYYYSEGVDLLDPTRRET